MNRLEALLEPLLDRLALKLANKVRAQLDGAVGSALDRAEDRIEEALERLEERLLAAANKAMADVMQPAIKIQGQIQDLTLHPLLTAEQVREAAEASGMKPAAELQQQMQVVAEAVGVTPVEAAKAAGGPQQRLDLAEQLRSRLSAGASRAAEKYRIEDAARAARLEIPDR